MRALTPAAPTSPRDAPRVSLRSIATVAACCNIAGELGSCPIGSGTLTQFGYHLCRTAVLIAAKIRLHLSLPQQHCRALALAPEMMRVLMVLEVLAVDPAVRFDRIRGNTATMQDHHAQCLLCLPIAAFDSNAEPFGSLALVFRRAIDMARTDRRRIERERIRLLRMKEKAPRATSTKRQVETFLGGYRHHPRQLQCSDSRQAWRLDKLPRGMMSQACGILRQHRQTGRDDAAPTPVRKKPGAEAPGSVLR